MVEQPSGTVTLVFTDIEGSTRLLHELGEGPYREALAEHRRIVRQSFGGCGGYEVDYEGDSFFYAFALAEDAVQGVDEAMRKLESGPIRLRVGLHTGTPVLDPPKYVGIDVHLAARVMSVGYGGQVLLSRATRELVEGEVLDLGEHRLKDFADPVWLYQLGSDQFPPLRSLNNTNLPTPASSFLGREAELAQADVLLGGSRLVSITGPGGAGKTRFAIELAARQLARFPNGVFWVPLAALRDPALVTETISHTLGAKDGLAEHIGERRMLLLIDNLEQVIEAAPELSTLASACANLSLLVTSRELLRVEGEVDFPLPPLDEQDAVGLFCERARSDPDPLIEDLCSRLDGLPLAIELAAARMSALTPAQLAQRLRKRLDLLKGRRDADPRQQTLRATIQWSYDLLSETEAALFSRLSVFAGGCTLEIAEEAIAADPDVLQSLVEKSLVRHTGDRFWMLETIREFGLDQLAAQGEAEAAYAAYRGSMLRMAESAAGDLEGPGGGAWLERLREEEDNVREVITLALDAADAEFALRVLTALDRYWWDRPGEAVGWFDCALELLDRVPPTLAAHTLRVAGTTAWFFGEPELTLERCRQALAIFEQLGDESGIGLMYSRIAPPLLMAGKLDEAEELLEKAAEIHGRLGQESELAIVFEILGSLAHARGELDRAVALYEQSTALAREIGDSGLPTRTLIQLGDVKIELGDPEAGIDLAREALQLAWHHRQLIDVGMCFGTLTEALARHGDIRQAAIFWGAGEKLDAELGPTQWRTVKAEQEATLNADVLADSEGIATGKGLPTADAVELALRLAYSAIDLSP